MPRLAALAAALALSSLAPAIAQTPPRPPAAAVAITPDEPVPRAARAEARRDCYAENVALAGDDLKAAMRECLQARFPGVQLYAQNGLTRDGKPTAATARAACKEEIDGRKLEGPARIAALTACFAAKRPDLAQRADCRKEARSRGLDGVALREAVTACERAAQS